MTRKAWMLAATGVGAAIALLAIGALGLGLLVRSRIERSRSHPSPVPTRVRNATHAMLMQTNAEHRLEVLHTSVRLAGAPCASVDGVSHRGFGSRDESYWTVSCGAEGAYPLSIAADGLITVVDCSVLVQAGVACQDEPK